MPAGLAGEAQRTKPIERLSKLDAKRTPQYRKDTSSEGSDELEGLDNDVVVEIIDRMGSSEEDDVEYLLQCLNNRQQWVRRSIWLNRYPQCQPMADIYELCRNNERKKKRIRHGIRSRAENRRDDALSPSSSDEGQASSDTYDSPNRKLKRRKRKELRKKAQEMEAASRSAFIAPNFQTSLRVAPEATADLPSASIDLNPRSPPKRLYVEVHPARMYPPKVIKVDEIAEKHKKILASYIPGKGKDFYTKGQYDCAFDMITFSALIDKNQPERIFNHRIANILGAAPNNNDFLVIVLQHSCDIANEMVEAIFPDMTLAITREALAAYAPKALRQYELIERLQQ